MKRGNALGRNITFISLIWPFIGLILAIKHYNKFNAKKIILFFCVLYGVTFVISEEMDADRYAGKLKADYEMPFEGTALYENFSGLYETSVDFFFPIITFIISRVTDSHHILFAVLALIFGYFWLKSIDFVNERFKLNKNTITICYAVLFISLIPIFNINGFRMWTAAWVFIYGVLQIVFNKDRRFLLLCLIACFIHFSFLTANVILILWMILGNHKWIYLSIALITFAVSELDLSVVRTFAENISPAIESKANAYASEIHEEKVNELRTDDVWFITLSLLLKKYLMLLNVLLLFYASLKQNLSKQEMNLMCFSLLFLSYTNIAALIPSGGRFTLVYFVFASIMAIILNSKYLFKSFYSVYGMVSFFTILLSVLITIRAAAPSINTILFAPGILVPFGYDLDWTLMDWMF